MTRKCSHCGHNGHNSTTCANRGVKLFGVRLIDRPIRKSVSMGNLLHYSNNASSSNNSPASASAMEPCESVANAAASADGYVSDGLDHNNSRGERKKDTRFTLDSKLSRLLVLWA